MEVDDLEELEEEEEDYEEDEDRAVRVGVTYQNQVHNPNLTDETDEGTIDNDRVEYAVLLPNSFTILDSTFDDQNSLL